MVRTPRSVRCWRNQLVRKLSTPTGKIRNLLSDSGDCLLRGGTMSAALAPSPGSAAGAIRRRLARTRDLAKNSQPGAFLHWKSVQ
jgi:hypothetical protein